MTISSIYKTYLKSVFFYTSLLLLVSCNQKTNDFKFNLKNKDSLNIQAQNFIYSISSNNSKASNKYREPEILWWNIDWNNKKKGKSSIIPQDISLNQIKELENLELDSIYLVGDTLKGFKQTIIDTCEGYDHIFTKTSFFSFVLKKQHITEILKYDYNPETLNRQITIGCFYIDDTEITSNEYRVFIPKTKQDSINALRYDSIKKAEKKAELDSIELHWNDYTLKQHNKN